MKPLWNSPSLGTLRAGPQKAVTFVVIAFGWMFFLLFIILAPLWPVVHAAWIKLPRRVWRGAVAASVAIAALLVFPLSPLYLGDCIPFALPGAGIDPLTMTAEQELLAIVAATTTQWVNLSLLVEVALLPLVVVTTIHTRRTRRRIA